MQYLLKKTIYKRNHVLYEEGVSSVDGVHLVVDGEFEVLQQKAKIDTYPNK